MSKVAELVFVPTPGMGHLVPAIELAKLVLRTNDFISVVIFILNIPSHTPKITAFVESESRDNRYSTRLTFVMLPPLSNLPEFSSTHHFASVIHLHKPLLKQAVEDRVTYGFFKPVGFVVDIFCVDMVDLAYEMHVPTYLFCITGACFLNLLFYAQSLADGHPNVDVAREFSRPEFSAVVPGFKNPVTSNVIPAILQEKSGCELLLNFARKFKKMRGILVNTFTDLETSEIQAVASGYTGEIIPPLYPVGPILKVGKKIGHGTSDNVDKPSGIQWLDAQPVSSVVFLCFGGWGTFDEVQVKEIANGLDRVGYRFFWALRKPPPKENFGAPSDNEPFLEALPEGFIERTRGRGKIVAWAQQVEILAHPAVGGFVSHCGWNSILESFWFGVPMATWPIYADQQLNAFKLVKELNLAVNITIDYKRDLIKGKSNFLVTAEEIEKGIKTLMNTDEEFRVIVRRMGDQGKKAMVEEGSSFKCLERFIEDILNNIA